MLEFIVAIVLLGITISGLFPLAVTYARILYSLEQRPRQLCLHPNPDLSFSYRTSHSAEWYQVPTTPAAPNSGEWVHRWYLKPPSTNEWAYKLGVGASLTDADPGPKPAPLVPTPDNLIADDSDAGYSDSGGDWASELDAQHFQGDRRRHAHPEGSPAPTSDEMAAWTFSQLKPGWYRVLARWTGAADQVTDATYTLYDGETLLADYPVVPVNQQNSSVGTDGWQTLQTVYVASGSATVRLSAISAANPNAYVVADGVRLAIVENRVEVVTLDRPPSNESEAASSRVKVETP
jgi:hypothetical protein